MKRRKFLKTAGVGAASLAASGARLVSQGQQKRPPNIVLIMADDLGAECLECYGGTSYRTPNLNALARSGIQFANAYCTPLCTPTRAQLMTGQYPFRNGWSEGIWTKPQDRQYLEPELPQVGQLMRSAGYATAVAGKWQLARFEDRPHHPDELGFDEHCLWTWTYTQAPKNIRMEGTDKPSRFWDPGVWHNGSLMEGTAGKFGPDIYTDFLVDFMRRHRSEPFFAYYPMALTHWPFVPPPGVQGRKDGTRVGPRGQRNFKLMVEYTDHLVGRIVQALKAMGLQENTLVLFTGDNGTAQELQSMHNGQVVAGGKRMLSEAGTCVPLLASWPETAPVGEVNRSLIDFTDILPTLAEMADSHLPGELTVDGQSFLPQLCGRKGKPREWVYCQVGDDWFIRNASWRLRKNGELSRWAQQTVGGQSSILNRYRPTTVKPRPGSKAADVKARLKQQVQHLRQS